MSEDLGSQVKKDSEAAWAVLKDGAKTAWELKMALKITHTRLHLALGALVERGRISLTSLEGTFKIEPLEPSSEAEPIPFRTNRPKIAAQ